MKKILALTVILVGLAVSSHAQQDVSPNKEITKEEKNKLKDKLNLTEEQSKELKSINTEFKEKALAIKDDKSLSKEQKKVKMQALHTERTSKTKTILTPEQQQKISQYKKAGHRKRHKNSATR